MDDLRATIERGKRLRPEQPMRVGDHPDARASAHLAIISFEHDHLTYFNRLDQETSASSWSNDDTRYAIDAGRMTQLANDGLMHELAAASNRASCPVGCAGRVSRTA
ncbi:hypothetical protein [Xanthomonas vasicola]|uniref:hypothetical protein n=1 Tax=Xanthomonas vasicola TaxID=56459 RepID=UPI0038AAC24C